MSARIGGIGGLVIGGKDYVCVDDLDDGTYSVTLPSWLADDEDLI